MLRKSHLIVALVTAGVFLLGATTHSQYIPHRSDLANILEGNWQSCKEADGQYSERVYDHVVNSVEMFEVHLGPQREFGIFPGVVDEHRAHETRENRLNPKGYKVSLQAGRAKQSWDVGFKSPDGTAWSLRFEVRLAGGSRTDCESWYILLFPKKDSSN